MSVAGQQDQEDVPPLPYATPKQSGASTGRLEVMALVNGAAAIVGLKLAFLAWEIFTDSGSAGWNILAAMLFGVPGILVLVGLAVLTLNFTLSLEPSLRHRRLTRATWIPLGIAGLIMAALLAAVLFNCARFGQPHGC